MRQYSAGIGPSKVATPGNGHDNRREQQNGSWRKSDVPQIPADIGEKP
jgi:hypothetical protein